MPRTVDVSLPGDRLCYSTTEAIRFDRSLVVQTPAGLVCALNETGAWLWTKLSQGASVAEAVAALARRFDRTPDDVKDEVSDLLQSWQDHDLVELVPMDTIPPRLLQQTAPLDDTFQIGETPVRVRCHCPEIAVKVEATFAPARVELKDGIQDSVDLYNDGGCFAVARNQGVVFRTKDPGYARGSLLQQLLRLSWPERSWLACVHGSAVGNGDSCLVLAGDCGSGKSVLTTAMVHAGFDFMTDDSVPLESASHHVWPLPFSICLKEEGAQLAEGLFPEIENLPSKMTDRGMTKFFFPATRSHPSSAGGLPVHALVFPRYQEGAELSLTPIDHGTALSRLCASGSSLDLHGFRLRESLAWLETMSCFALTYSSFRSATATLKELWAPE